VLTGIERSRDQTLKLMEGAVRVALERGAAGAHLVTLQLRATSAPTRLRLSGTAALHWPPAQGQDFVRVTDNEKPPSVTCYPTGLKRSAFIDLTQPLKDVHYDQRFSGNRTITPRFTSRMHWSRC
jgi:hypothetical protein